MAIAGRVAIVPKGDWSAETEYKRLDEVTYNNTMFIAKKAAPKGTLPTNAEYWSKSIVGGVGAIATKEDAGIVKPADGLSIAEDGTLKVSIDGTTLTMDQVNNVIKLADTLKEKINGAFPAANVVNNQITTEEGFALDARQANPNLEGTLAKQVADLNGSKVNYADSLPCYSFPLGSLDGITNNSFENIKLLRKFSGRYFYRGSLIHIERLSGGGAYDTFFIGSTNPSYFKVLCVTFYEDLYITIYNAGSGWSGKKSLTS